MIVNYRNSKDNKVIFLDKNPKYIPNINEKFALMLNKILL